MYFSSNMIVKLATVINPAGTISPASSAASPVSHKAEKNKKNNETNESAKADSANDACKSACSGFAVKEVKNKKDPESGGDPAPPIRSYAPEAEDSCGIFATDFRKVDPELGNAFAQSPTAEKVNEKRDPESECRFVPEVSCGIFANDDDAKKMEFKCEVKEAKYEMVGDMRGSVKIRSDLCEGYGLSGKKEVGFGIRSKLLWVVCLQLFGGVSAVLEGTVSNEPVKVLVGNRTDNNINLRGGVFGFSETKQDDDASSSPNGGLVELNKLSNHLETRPSFCGIDRSAIDPFLEPPEEVQKLLALAFGASIEISPVSNYAASNSACSDLSGVLNSEKEHVVVAIGSKDSNSKKKVTTGSKAKEKNCERNRKKGKKSCHSTKAKATDFIPSFPMCMAIRPCNDDDVLLKQVKLGFVSDDGIPIFKYPPYLDVSFQGFAFDTAGSLAMPTFSVPLIDPNNPSWEGAKTPDGMHFWIKGLFEFPLKTKVKGKKGSKFADVSLTAQGGIFAKVISGCDESSDIVPFLESLGDIDDLAAKVKDIDTVFFQYFFDASATMSIDLGALFPVKLKGYSMKITQSFSSMMEVSIAKTSTSKVNCSKRAEGASCTSDKECISEMCFCGRCKLPSRKVANGGACSDHYFCSSGFCKGKSADGCTGTCAAKVETGGACSENRECHSNDCQCGRCIDPSTKIPNGHSCASDSDCTSGYCDGFGFFGLSCSGTCKTAPQLGAGSSCSKDSECASRTCTCWSCTDSNKKVLNRFRCDADSECQSQHCSTWIDFVGCFGSCLPSGVGAWCMFDRDCKGGGGTCLCQRCTDKSMLLEDSFKCDYNSECKSGYCKNGKKNWYELCPGTCSRKPLEEGDLCSEDDQCKSRTCLCGVCSGDSQKLDVGMKCDQDSFCISNYCDGGNGSKNCDGTCKKKDAGGRCNDSHECVSNECLCGKCTDSSLKHAVGLACDLNSQCKSHFCTSDIDDAPGCVGICEKKGGGSPCSSKEECESNECICGSCTDSSNKLPNDFSCDQHIECQSNACGGRGEGNSCIGKCKKKADVGSSCTESEECVSNQCLCGSCTDLSKMNQNDYGCSQHTDCISGYCSITDENCVGVCQDGPPTSSPTISLAPTYSSTPKKKSEMSAVGLSVDGSWLHPDQPDSLGKYFSYDADLWNHYFGTVLVSTQGTQVAVKQCRDGAEIWTGEVSIWPNIPNFKGHELPPSGRRNVGANKGQWEKHDYVVKTSESCFISSLVPTPTLKGMDIGSIWLRGRSVEHSGGIFEVLGSGADIWGRSDQFQYFQQSMSGAGKVLIQMHINSFDGHHWWMKGGLMIRESLDANSRHFSLFMTRSGNSLCRQSRSSKGGISYHDQPFSIRDRKLNIRIIKQGHVFWTYYARESDTGWKMFGPPRYLPFYSDKFYVGVAVTSHNIYAYSRLKANYFVATYVNAVTSQHTQLANETIGIDTGLITTDQDEGTSEIIGIDIANQREDDDVSYEEGLNDFGVDKMKRNFESEAEDWTYQTVDRHLAKKQESISHPISVWYESLSGDADFSSNTYTYAQDLCRSKGEKLATLSQICPDESPHRPTHGYKYGNQWTACSDYENCWVQIGDTRNSCKTYFDVHGEQPRWGQDYTARKPWAKFVMCMSEEETDSNATPKITKMLAHRDTNDKLIEIHGADNLEGQAHLRLDDYLANSHIAFWRSFSRLIDVQGILAPLAKPLGKFGKWILPMVPTLELQIQEYIKIPLSGLPEFITRFSSLVKIDCGPIKAIGDTIKDLDPTWDNSVYNAVWPNELDTFCGQKQEIGVQFSIGFKGFYIDPKNTYVAAKAGSNNAKISMDIFPSCQAPVKVGGRCSVNEDCVNHDDDTTKQYKKGSGYCRNGEVAGIYTSLGCSGTCMEKLPAGADCRRESLDIEPLDFTNWDKIGSGPDEACEHGKCLCGQCTGQSKKLPLNSKCSVDGDCEDHLICDGFLSLDCSGRCKPKLKAGALCHIFDGSYNDCASGECICSRCAKTSTRKLPRGYPCSENSDCENNCECCVSFHYDIPPFGPEGNLRVCSPLSGSGQVCPPGWLGFLPCLGCPACTGVCT